MNPCRGLCAGTALRDDPSILIRQGRGGRVGYQNGWKLCKNCEVRFLAPLLIKCPCCGAGLRSRRHSSYRPGTKRAAPARY